MSMYVCDRSLGMSKHIGLEGVVVVVIVISVVIAGVLT